MTRIEQAIAFLFGEPKAPDIDVEETFCAMDDNELRQFISICKLNLSRAETHLRLREVVH